MRHRTPGNDRESHYFSSQGWNSRPPTNEGTKPHLRVIERGYSLGVIL